MQRWLDRFNKGAENAAQAMRTLFGAGARQGAAAANGAASETGGASGDDAFPPSLAGYVWRQSRGRQLVLLAVTALTFPLLYASLELPKAIINDAISADVEAIEFLGVSFSRVEYLLLLCAGFLAAVLGGGLLKMRLNTMKGVLAEGLLRRFRFQLISRTLRFPLPHFQRTSQGELISMVTAEAEPLGGAMGDLVAQPAFQAGQMLTIMLFLFMQNFWLGLAATALIPVQAWLIPMLQRRINVLHKERVAEVRRLSARFGETIAGVEDLRANNGARRALADFSSRLGRLFDIRYDIYRKKFFMKFLNNFITQLTPFFFFSIGGYLAIEGQLTVGALVAALAAYKDLSAPWRELLTYFTQIMELSVRYRNIVEQFDPQGIAPARLFAAQDVEPPRLDGAITVQGATMREMGGAPVLEDLTFKLPAGGMIAIQSRSASERRALAQLLSRGASPSSGRIAIGEHDLAELSQAAIAARVGVASASPYLFNASIWENAGMALQARPLAAAGADGAEAAGAQHGAGRDGERGPIARRLFGAELAFDASAFAERHVDPFEAPWLDPTLAGVEDVAALRAWWLRIVDAIGTGDKLVQRGLERRFAAADHPELAERLTSLREEALFRIRAAGLDSAVHWFREEQFNPGLALAGNLLFAAPKKVLRAEEIAEKPRYAAMIRQLGLEPDMNALGTEVMSLLIGAFGAVGPRHPLFQRLDLGAETFERLKRIAERRMAHGPEALCPEDRALVSALPFQLTAEQIGQAFPEPLKRKILALRRARSAELRASGADLFSPLVRDRFVDGLTTLENLLYGAVSRSASPAARERVREIARRLIDEAGLTSDIALLVGDVEAGIGGANLDPASQERIAFVRAAIKRPDVLIMDQAMASQSPNERLELRARLRELLPETTLIFLEPEVLRPNDFDLVLEIEDGRISEDGTTVCADAEKKGGEKKMSAGDDLIRKRRVFETCPPFRDLARSQLRLLAYASQWFEAEAGEAVFQRGDPTDGAYILTRGMAELLWTAEDGSKTVIDSVVPGRLIGDLSVILDQDRSIDMVAATDIAGVRIGAEELRAVIRGDASVATSLLETVAEHLLEVSDMLRDSGGTVRDAREDFVADVRDGAGASRPPGVGGSSKPQA